MDKMDKQIPTFEELHRHARELEPQLFNGFMFNIQKTMSPNFMVSHAIKSTMLGESSYSFGTTYIGTKAIRPNESYPILMSELQANGALNCNLIHMISSGLRFKFVGSFTKNACTGSQSTLEYRGKNFSSCFTAANIDLFKNTGIVLGQYLHQITKKLLIGPEVMVHYGEHESQIRAMTQVSLGALYTGDECQAAATISANGIHASYSHKINDKFDVGTELNVDKMSKQTTSMIYYKYDLSKSGVVLRGGISSDGLIFAVTEKQLKHLPMILQVSTALDHAKNLASCGLGLQVGGSF